MGRHGPWRPGGGRRRASSGSTLCTGPPSSSCPRSTLLKRWVIPAQSRCEARFERRTLSSNCTLFHVTGRWSTGKEETLPQFLLSIRERGRPSCLWGGEERRANREMEAGNRFSALQKTILRVGLHQSTFVKSATHWVFPVHGRFRNDGPRAETRQTQ